MTLLQKGLCTAKHAKSAKILNDQEQKAGRFQDDLEEFLSVLRVLCGEKGFCSGFTCSIVKY
jgi:hypothetical protein